MAWPNSIALKIRQIFSEEGREVACKYQGGRCCTAGLGVEGWEPHRGTAKQRGDDGQFADDR